MSKKYTVTLPDHIVEGEPTVTCLMPNGGRLVFHRSDNQTSRDVVLEEAVAVQLRADGYTVELATKKAAKPKPDPEPPAAA